MCLDTWVQIADIASPVIALFGLGFIYKQLRDSANQAKRQRTYEISGRYQNPEFFDRVVTAGRFLRSKEKFEVQKYYDYIKNANPQITKDVYIVFAFFEDLSLLYNRNHLDKDMINDLLKTAIISFYEDGKWLIDRSQAENAEAYKQYTLLYNTLKNESAVSQNRCLFSSSSPRGVRSIT